MHAVMMPSRYTSTASLEDAGACALALGLRYDIVDIEPAVAAFRDMLLPLFGNAGADVTGEHSEPGPRRHPDGTVEQARRHGGDDRQQIGNGGGLHAALWRYVRRPQRAEGRHKTTVFELCRWRNRHLPEGALGPAGRVIPERIIAKPPSAELRADQKDEDSLPPYPTLDAPSCAA